MNQVEEVYDFLKECKTYFLATVDEKGNPHVRPFGSYAIIDGKLYFQTSKIKEVYRELKINPRFEISSYIDGRWIRLTGTAEEDDETAKRKAMLDAMPELRKMYSENDGKCAVFFIKDAVATFCSFATKPVKVSF